MVRTTAAEEDTPPRVTRRRLLAWGLGATATILGAGAAAEELVSHGVLPGQQLLLQLDGACAVPVPAPKGKPSGLHVLFSLAEPAKTPRARTALPFQNFPRAVQAL